MYQLSDLTIDICKDHLKRHSLIELEPGKELFTNGLTIDIQSINVICLIYDNLKPSNQAAFNTRVFGDEYRFANFIDNMWKMVK